MAGLSNICKLYGSMIVGGKRMVWDYVADKAVPEEEMPDGSDRWRASEVEKWTARFKEKKDD